MTLTRTPRQRSSSKRLEWTEAWHRGDTVAKTSPSNSILDDDDTHVEEDGPTDADVEHIQAVADAKVGEDIEGLLNWSRTLSSSNEPKSPSAPPSFDTGNASSTSPAGHPRDATTAKSPSAQVVDLVSDSEEEESSAHNDDPDKENDVSLVSATLRLDSDFQLPTFSGKAISQQTPGASGSRTSLVGPLFRAINRKSFHHHHHQAPTEPRFIFQQAINSSQSADTSATETVRNIGRQNCFVQPSRQRIVPLSSTPLHIAQTGQRDRSFSFGSNTSLLSPSALSITTSSSTVYKKRDPIYRKRHQHKVGRYNESTIQHSIETARRNINRFLSSSRKPKLSREHFGALVAKTQQVHALIAQDNPKDVERGKVLDDMMHKFMRQRQLDAQTAVLPLPPVVLEQRQRMAREQRLKERKLRGVLGRLRLPHQLGPEQEQAASMAFSRRGVVSEMTGASVSDQDLQKLLPGKWLNDEIINFYGTLILNRANDADKKRTEAMAAAKDAPAPSALPAPSSNRKGRGKDKGTEAIPPRPYDKSLDAFWRVHFFNSFFWTNLKSKGFDGVKRWTRRVDLFSKDIILFPINIGNAHWVCGAINMRKHRFEYYDSLGAANKSAFTLMRDYLTQEARDKKKKEIDLRGWTDLFSDESPQQENAFDCGVFASQTLEQISRRDPFTPIPLDPPSIVWKGESLDHGAQKLSLGGEDGDDEFDDLDYEWNFSQENMPYLRKRMAYEIFTKQLLG